MRGIWERCGGNVGERRERGKCTKVYKRLSVAFSTAITLV
jgi:hypothetical protein